MAFGAARTASARRTEETMHGPVTSSVTVGFALDSVDLFKVNIKSSHGENKLPQIYDFCS